jgi:hypothetical protein
LVAGGVIGANTSSAMMSSSSMREAQDPGTGASAAETSPQQAWEEDNAAPHLPPMAGSDLRWASNAAAASAPAEEAGSGGGAPVLGQLERTEAAVESPNPDAAPAEEVGRRPSGCRRRRARTGGLSGRERPIHDMLIPCRLEELLVAALLAEAEVGGGRTRDRRAGRQRVNRSRREAARPTLGAELGGHAGEEAELDGERTPRGCRIWSRWRETKPVAGDQAAAGGNLPQVAMVARAFREQWSPTRFRPNFMTYQNLRLVFLRITV